MLKKPKYLGKIIGFSIALILFIVTKVFQSNMDAKLGDVKGQIAGIEKEQEAYLRYMLIGTEEFHHGENNLTLGQMTWDVDHDISAVYKPVSRNMLNGLRTLA